MRKVVLIVVPILLAYLLLTFFTGSLFGLQGSKLWILRGALWLIGLAVAFGVGVLIGMAARGRH